jgi:hypothetical protein
MASQHMRAVEQGSTALIYVHSFPSIPPMQRSAGFEGGARGTDLKEIFCSHKVVPASQKQKRQAQLRASGPVPTRPALASGPPQSTIDSLCSFILYVTAHRRHKLPILGGAAFPGSSLPSLRNLLSFQLKFVRLRVHRGDLSNQI